MLMMWYSAKAPLNVSIIFSDDYKNVKTLAQFKEEDIHDTPHEVNLNNMCLGEFKHSEVNSHVHNIHTILNVEITEWESDDYCLECENDNLGWSNDYRIELRIGMSKRTFKILIDDSCKDEDVFGKPLILENKNNKIPRIQSIGTPSVFTLVEIEINDISTSD